MDSVVLGFMIRIFMGGGVGCVRSMVDAGRGMGRMVVGRN